MKLISKIGDLRFVIGLFFSIIGILLLLTSVITGNDLVVGVRLNFITGAIMGLFGAGMLLSSQSN